MSEAARRAASLTSPTWIMAHVQTGGRGRRGKPWITPAGNLSATLIYKPDATPAAAARRSFVAANALYAALSFYVDAEKLALKWPNDVLLDGHKVAGILLEASGQGSRVGYLSIGFGVNLAHTPQGVEDAAFAPTSVTSGGGEPVSPEAFLTTLAGCFATQESKLARFGFARIRQDWLKNAARLGEVISAKTGTETISGIFDTIDDDGNLVLITGAGPRAISAADVFF